MSVADEILRLQQAKADLKTAIEAKGVTVPAATTIDGYAALVDQIQQGGGTLPYDSEIEYLQSGGGPYIDTGIVASGEFDISLKIKFTSPLNTSNNVVFGGIRSSTQFLTIAQKTSGNQFVLGYAGNFWNITNLAVAANTLYNISLHYYNGSQYATINGTQYGAQTYSGTLSSDLSIYLFKRHHYGTDSVADFKGSLYSAQITKDGVLVRDYIPVRVGTVGLLYDKVSGKLFGNMNSTGAFTIGPDVT